jgi:hypothetical protein
VFETYLKSPNSMGLSPKNLVVTVLITNFVSLISLIKNTYKPL